MNKWVWEIPTFCTNRTTQTLKTSTNKMALIGAVYTKNYTVMACFRTLFEKSAESNRLISSQNIFTALKNSIFKLYFYFLSFILPKFTNFNKLFQRETPNIHFLTNYLASTYKAFLNCYLSSTYIHLTSLHCIDPASPSNLLPLTSMNMGGKVS